MLHYDTKNERYIFQSMHAENVEKRRRTNVMISSIAVVFFVSWLPLNVFDLLMKLVPEVRYDFRINQVFKILSLSSFIFLTSLVHEMLTINDV